MQRLRACEGEVTAMGQGATTEPEWGEKLRAFLLGFLGSHSHGALHWGSEVGSVEFLGPLQYQLFHRVTCMDPFKRTILKCCSESGLE